MDGVKGIVDIKNNAAKALVSSKSHSTVWESVPWRGWIAGTSICTILPYFLEEMG